MNRRFRPETAPDNQRSSDHAQSSGSRLSFLLAFFFLFSSNKKTNNLNATKNMRKKPKRSISASYSRATRRPAAPSHQHSKKAKNTREEEPPAHLLCYSSPRKPSISLILQSQGTINSNRPGPDFSSKRSSVWGGFWKR
jgi:hypothetical protein